MISKKTLAIKITHTSVKKLILLIIPLLFSLTTHSQNKENDKIKKQSPTTAIQGKYEPNTVVFKIKKQFRSKLEHQNRESLFNNLKFGNDFQITSLEKKFPNSIVPQKEKNHLGQSLIDLSLIYILRYEGNIPLETLIDLIKKSELVEYVEPSYVEDLLSIPNDPYAQPGAEEYTYLSRMKAFEAFDIEKGDTNVVIGIIDTGVKWDHEDLKDKIKNNYADPIDGADNDGDGYIDNFRGWDLANGDNNPYSPTANIHGTFVAGVAGATPNNGLGICGTGYNCKLLPIKAATDVSSGIVKGYEGVIYAADHNCKVINLSWGSPGTYSAIAQDMINYAAINKDVVIIAAAGNTFGDFAFYPASYDNVMSVGAYDTMYYAPLDSIIERPAYFATYNHNIDIGAMGMHIVSAKYSGYLTEQLGTSHSTPQVSGAAALVRSKYPSLKASQVIELLRVTADPLIDSVPNNINFKKEKCGKGRLNMYRALTDSTSPAIRMFKYKFYSDLGTKLFGGDTVKLESKFRNYLRPTNNAKVTLTCSNPNVEIIKGDFTIGSLGTLDSIQNNSTPFIIYIKPQAKIMDTAEFRIGYKDVALNYDDYQYISVIINKDEVIIDTNQVDITITNNGRFGYNDGASTSGKGITYKGNSILWESGLMISSGSTKVSDCVRGATAGTTNLDFKYLSPSKYIPSAEADQETLTLLTDTISSNPVGVIIRQRTYAHHNIPDDKYVVIEYDITNVSGDSIDSLHVGLYSDWDIQNAAQNKANWNNDDSIGYTYYTAANGIYAGVCLLTKNRPSCFSLDHSASVGGNINPNDGFTDAEKFKTLSSGISRPKAGGTGSGADVSQVVAGLLTNLANNETRTIAFAYVVGDDVLDLKASARRAKNLFRSFNTSNTPTVSNQNLCNKDTAMVIIAPGNGTKFNFYQNPSDTTPVHTGDTYVLNNIFTSDTIYIRGADSLFESGTVSSKIIFHSEVKADFGFAPDTVDLNIYPYAFFIDKSKNATQLIWDLGDGFIINNQTSFLHQYTSVGNYKVILTASGAYTCTDTISKNIVIKSTNTGINSTSNSDVLNIFPNPASEFINIELGLTQSQNIKIDIFNSLGQEVYSTQEKNISAQNFKIPTSKYQKGIYHVKIQIGEQLTTKTFVVQ